MLNPKISYKAVFFVVQQFFELFDSWFFIIRLLL